MKSRGSRTRKLTVVVTFIEKWSRRRSIRSFWNEENISTSSYVFGVFDVIHSLLEHRSRSCLHEVRSHGNVEVLTETIIEIEMMGRHKSILGLLLEKGHEVICVPRSEERGIEIRRRGQHTVLELGNSLEIVESFLVPAWTWTNKSFNSEEWGPGSCCVRKRFCTLEYGGVWIFARGFGRVKSAEP